MKFEKFVEKAQRITPTDYSVCCQSEQWRHSVSPLAEQRPKYVIAIVSSHLVKTFESKSPKKALSKLQNYFDTL